MTIRGEAPAAGAGRRARAQDVARLAGVSPQTVSRVTNDAANVRPETRARVLDAMAKLGYAPNHAARALRSGRLDTIGVIVHHLARTGEARIMEAVARTAHASGFAVSLLDATSEDVADMNSALTQLRQDVAGLVILSLETADVEGIRMPGGLPVVAADSRTLQHASVGFDQRGGARLAVTHLLDLGHRTVHLLGGPELSLQASERASEWRQVLLAAGRRVVEPLHGDWTLASGYRLGRELAGDPTVTAVFAANDEMAAGLLRALHEAGRRVPQDVSVVGFDDVIGGYLWPPLTTVHQDFTAMGENMVHALVGMVRGHASVPVEPVVPLVGARLVVRDSTAPAPA